MLDILSSPTYSEQREQGEAIWVEPLQDMPSPPTADWADAIIDLASNMDSAWSRTQYTLTDTDREAAVNYVLSSDVEAIRKWSDIRTSKLENVDSPSYQDDVMALLVVAQTRDLLHDFKLAYSSVGVDASRLESDIAEFLRKADKTGPTLSDAFASAARDIIDAIDRSWSASSEIGVSVDWQNYPFIYLKDMTRDHQMMWDTLTAAVNGTPFELPVHLARFQEQQVVDRVRELLAENEGWIPPTEDELILLFSQMNRDDVLRTINVLKRLHRLVTLAMHLATIKISRISIDWDSLIYEYLIDPAINEFKSRIVRLVSSRILPLLYDISGVLDILERIPDPNLQKTVARIAHEIRRYVEIARRIMREWKNERERRKVFVVAFSRDLSKTIGFLEARNVLERVIRTLERYLPYTK